MASGGLSRSSRHAGLPAGEADADAFVPCEKLSKGGKITIPSKRGRDDLRRRNGDVRLLRGGREREPSRAARGLPQVVSRLTDL